MADDTQQQPAPIDQNALLQALIQQQLAAASGQGQQVQLPSLPAPQAQTQYSNDPDKGPGLLARIGLALGGGSLPGAPAELRSQMGAQALMNFGVGLMGAGKFATPGEVLAGGFRGAQAGLLGSEAAQAGQQEYALNAQAKLAELGMQQQKNRTEALTALVPLLQMRERLGLPPLFGPGSQAGPPGGGPGGGGDGQDIYSLPKDQFLTAVAQRESGGDPTKLNYVAKADPSAYARGATASGKYQMLNSTWLTAAKGAGIDTAKYPTAMSAPEALQDKAASWLYDNQGTKPWDPSQWSKNWVLGSDGKYTLQTAPYQPPPGTKPSSGTPPTQGAGSAVGPYRVTSRGDVAPPSAPAAGGPPAPSQPPSGDTWDTSGAPAGPARLPEPPQPPAEGIPLPGNTGLRLYPDGSVGTPGQQGRPAITAEQAPGGQKAPPPNAQPTLGPVGPITAPPATPAPPAAQPQPPQVQPPAPPPAQPPPGAAAPSAQPTEPPVSLEDFAQQHGVGKLDQPDPASVKAADANIQAAQTQLQQIRRGQLSGDVNKAMSDVQAAQNERDKLFSDARDKFYSTIAIPAYKAQVLDPWNTARQQQQASDLKIKEGLVAAGTADDQKVLQGIDATTESAHDTLSTLEAAKRLSVAAGNKSALATLAPGVATMLQRSGLLSQDESNKLDAQSALDGVLSKMAGTMRTSMGFSRMTNMDLQFLQNMVGTSNLPESRRNAMFAFMQTALERQYQYGALVREFYGGGPNAGGMTLAKAREAADDKLNQTQGRIVQTVPDGLDPAKGDLFVQQHVSPGTFYVRDGQLRIRGQ